MKPDSSNGSAPISGDARAMLMYEANKKSLVASYVLWFFVGAFGGHRFYNARTGTAVVQLSMCLAGLMLTFVFGIGLLLLIPLGLWLLADAFLIPGWVTAHNAALARQLADGGAD